jgi:hypothetical protein
MKYHFMRVSTTTVRIELLPEDKAEEILLQQLSLTGPDNPNLAELFEKAIALYHPKLEIISKSFMEFPKVALCSYKMMSTLSTA